jgi:hypothetical protein
MVMRVQDSCHAADADLAQMIERRAAAEVNENRLASLHHRVDVANVREAVEMIGEALPVG